MNSTGKTKASQSALANASESTRKLNPHLFLYPSLANYENLPKSITKPKKRIRQDKPMNKLEQEAFEYIKALPHIAAPSPKYRHVRAQSKTFRLANALRYTPDVTALDHIWCAASPKETCFEVKGKHAWDDAIAKLKMAASVYPEIRWILMWKDQGQWQFQEVLP